MVLEFGLEFSIPDILEQIIVTEEHSQFQTNSYFSQILQQNGEFLFLNFWNLHHTQIHNILLLYCTLPHKKQQNWDQTRSTAAV